MRSSAGSETGPTRAAAPARRTSAPASPAATACCRACLARWSSVTFCSSE
ncbi:hypothetical protein [Fodinicola feengrottensis]|nr:hypothetical protein [Fodinicola feengrottensis]